MKIETQIDHDLFCTNSILACLQPGKRSKNAVDSLQEVKTKDTEDHEEKEYLLCTECKYPIARIVDRIEINEKHQHVFANPHGYIFQIGCFAQAPGCIITGEETSFFSWFPGFNWRIALCGQCWTLLGWTFRSTDSQFFGLILDKLTFITTEEKNE